MSINKLLDVAGRSLLTYQKALNVTSHNISNSNNPNYSKQRVTFNSIPSEYSYGFGIGSGVELGNVLRIRDRLTDKQIVQYNQDYNYNKEFSETIGQIEQLYSEPSELGLSNLLNNFFNSWDELASDPESTPLRNEVINAAQKVSTKMSNVYEGYQTVKNDVKSEAKETVNTINVLIDDIYNLNKEIYSATAVGRTANDLLDKRAAKISELSEYVNITVNYDEDNVANVSMGGSFAVDRTHREQYILAEEDGKLRIKPDEESGHITVTSGKIAALNDTFSKTIPKHLESLDKIAQTLMDQTNSVHSQGYTLHEPPLTGIDFFSEYKHGQLSINEDILADSKYIAVSADQKSGNGDIALSLAALKDSEAIDGSTIGGFYSDLVSDMANSKVKHEQATESNGLVLEQLELTKAQYSGVSTDEEMVNVIKFQRSYNASAKLIQVADDLFQTLIGMV